MPCSQCLLNNIDTEPAARAGHKPNFAHGVLLSCVGTQININPCASRSNKLQKLQLHPYRLSRTPSDGGNINLGPPISLKPDITNLCPTHFRKVSNVGRSASPSGN